VATELHQRLMALALELQGRGDVELAAWIQKHVAGEQREAKKRPSRRGVRVRLARARGTAVLPLAVVNEALRQEGG
jgi:hypothetical protein